jgi:hypothetical protein
VLAKPRAMLSAPGASVDLVRAGLDQPVRRGEYAVR